MHFAECSLPDGADPGGDQHGGQEGVQLQQDVGLHRVQGPRRQEDPALPRLRRARRRGHGAQNGQTSLPDAAPVLAMVRSHQFSTVFRPFSDRFPTDFRNGRF